MHKPVAWSYSALNAYETCARRYCLTKVTKEVVEGQTEATLWGNRVHKAFELKFKNRQPFPDTLKQFEPVAETVLAASKGGKIEAETKMALTVNYKPTTWFAKDVWVRGITDFTITKGDKVFIGDIKTGRPTPESAQLRLTAAMTFAQKPHIKTIVNSFIWLKTGGHTTEVFTREDVPAIWQEFAPRVARLNNAVAENKFPPKPSGLCARWCPVPKRLCEFSGKD